MANILIEPVDDTSLWRRCEIAWISWLQASGHTVTALCEALGNSYRTKAPLMALAGQSGMVRAPDLQSTKAGVIEYWEVKSRLRPDVDPLSGLREFWIDYDCFSDYRKVEKHTGHPVRLVLYEAPTSITPGRWLRADVRYLAREGREGMRSIGRGERHRAWIWPASAMEVISGPEVRVDSAYASVIPGEERCQPTAESEFEIFEWELRTEGNQSADLADGSATPVPNRVELQNDPIAALDVLRRKLGVPALPRYSVMRIGNSNLDDVLALLHYGIRVFLVTSESPALRFDKTELLAFRQSRLLEWSVIPELSAERECWIVDGGDGHQTPSWIEEVLSQVEEAGGININQYRIVHAPPGSDIVVSAGAGTGKTETMSERLVFLLATVSTLGDGGLSVHPADLRLDQVGLVTFTREAAREMRSRLARTIMLRQRLSRRCIHPTAAWLMQLGGARISTLHMFARRLLQKNGGALGLSRDFRVSEQRTRLRDILTDELSARLVEQYRLQGDNVPAIHLWQRHIEAVWGALENNGIPLLGFSEPLPEDLSGRLDWGGDAVSGLNAEVTRITREVIEAATRRFGDRCADEQVVPTGQLVPGALLALREMAPTGDARTELRFLFVDEFQDTDSLQMDLLIELREKWSSRLFVVGDAKQGIYRFRGAEGNAFEVLRERISGRGLAPFLQFSLNRNFRSGGLLLDSIHGYFEAWGAHGLLGYKPGDQLRSEPLAAKAGSALRFRRIQDAYEEFPSAAAAEVRNWRDAEPDCSIAVLCRRNRHAMRVQSAIRSTGGSCDLLVGGEFYRCPAVREMRVFLEAIFDPADDAALLELCESRWAGALLGRIGTNHITRDDSECWTQPADVPWSWRKRLASLAISDNFHRADLNSLRRRVVSLRSALRTMSAMTFTTECRRWLAPESCSLAQRDDDSERRRYARCIDHLITLMDAQFVESPATLAGILGWLQLQIATNKSEDEPVDRDALEGRTAALTVHKSKGLEFDYVIVPNTWTPFGLPQQVMTHVAVLQEQGGRRRVLWRWQPDNNGKAVKFSNDSPGDAGRWDIDGLETRREEARLLYVAMTRARKGLLLFRPDSNPKDTWHELLAMGDA